MQKRTRQGLITAVAAVLALASVIYRSLIGIQAGWISVTTLAGWINLTSIIYFAIIFCLFIVRKPTQDECRKFSHWLIALLSVWIPFLLRAAPQPSETITQLAAIITLAGMALSLLALLTLGRAFGIFAARREIRITGVYRLLRHPLYAGEILILLGPVMANPLWSNTLIFIFILVCLWLRMNDEEAVLSKDDSYADYLRQVRYRLIPGVV